MKSFFVGGHAEKEIVDQEVVGHGGEGVGAQGPTAAKGPNHGAPAPAFGALDADFATDVSLFGITDPIFLRTDLEHGGVDYTDALVV